MRLDLVVPNESHFSLETVKASPEFEAMGYDGLWFTDHVVGLKYYAPVYTTYWLEVLSVLSHVAAITKTVRLGIGVLVIPYRDAVYTAKALATIDNLSGGRIDLGVGTGWARAEFHALGRGAIFEERGAYTDEALEVMNLAWNSKGETEYSGRFSEFRKIVFEPSPVQKPRIPFWIGARGTEAKAPMRRAAKYADVWHPTGVAASEMREASARLNEMAGREIPTSIRTAVTADMSVGQIVDHLAGYHQAGCIEAALDIKVKSVAELRDMAAKVIEAAAPLRR